MRVAVCSLLLLATLASAGRPEVADDGAIIEDIALPQDARVVRVLEGAAAASSDASEEVVDVRVEAGDNGEMRMEFTSHGRKHDLKLVKSRVQLEDVPVRFLGSEDGHDESVAKAREVTMMVDRKHGATIAVKSDDDGNIEPMLHSGLFKLGDFEFNVAPHSDGKVKVSKRSVAQPIFDHDAIERTVEEKTRQARSDPSPSHEYEALHINCELEVVADYSMYRKFQELSAPVGMGAMDADADLLLYFGHIVSAMDITYGSIVNNLLTAQVSLTGITVFTTTETQPQIIEELTYEVDGVTYVDGSSVLSALSVTRSNDYNIHTIFPPSDHLMLFTNYDLTTSGDDGLLGVAYLSGVCSQSSGVSLVEARQTQGFVAVVAIHELGHNLAMPHDETSYSTQCQDENFIMSPYAGNPGNLQNRFLFSCCGQRTMYWRLRQSQYMCLQQNGTANNPFVDDSVDNYLPGEVYDEDDQCYLALGTPACDDSVYVTVGESKCLNLYCVDPDDSMNCVAYTAAALDGTSCDESGGICYQGQCVFPADIPTVSSHTCDVFDCYGSEFKCATGVANSDTYGTCVQESWICDGYVDCEDGSDEAPQVCPKCADRKWLRNKCYTIKRVCRRAKTAEERRKCRRRCRKNRVKCCKTCCETLGLCETNEG